MNWWAKMKRNITEPEVSAKLNKWKKRYDECKNAYADTLNAIESYDKQYNGDHGVKGKNGQEARKKATNVRNIDFELIESQVDSAIPMPKVTPIHEEDVELAKTIEEFLTSEITKLDLKVINDMQERTTPIQGGCFTLIEWDNTKGSHCAIGDIEVTDIHPREFIPQRGVVDIDKMDYFFIRKSQTKEYVKRRFGKDVTKEDETDKEIREDVNSDDIVTVVTVYYKNKDNGIGLYRFCGDVELEDLEDYEARYVDVCEKCGATVEGDKCPECGSKKHKRQKLENDTVTKQFVIAEPNLGGDVTESIVEEVYQLPFYRPSQFPIVLRKNISRSNRLLGFSDVEVIMDQQEAIKKYGTKMDEKLLKGGSYVLLPDGLGVETTDEELKIIRLQNPQQKSMIDVITVQADTTQDRITLETNYSWAKSALGITDAYQGKYDSSATSGAAKQYSINQAAGRLESKRVMKNEAYAKIYEYIFKLALAYADQPIPVIVNDSNGQKKFSHFDKSDFLKTDSAGELYWNDEFLFEIDPTSTLLTNREAMWNQLGMMLQSGAFGPIAEDETNYLYWLEMEKNGYPNAGAIKNEIVKRLEKKQAEMEQMQMNGGTPNEMPVM